MRNLEMVITSVFARGVSNALRNTVSQACDEFPTALVADLRLAGYVIKRAVPPCVGHGQEPHNED